MRGGKDPCGSETALLGGGSILPCSVIKKKRKFVATKKENMLKNRIILSTVVIALFTIASCSDKVTAPRFTYVEKIVQVKPGYDLTQVKNILGTEPYDMYVDQSSGKVIYIWLYKHNERWVSSKLLDKKEGAIAGDDRVKVQSTLYCIFDNDYVLESISTEAGRADAVRLVLFDNTFRTVTSDVEKYNAFSLPSDRPEIDLSEKKSATGGIFGKKK